MTTHEVVVVLDAVIRLVQVVYDWLNGDTGGHPLSACATALASMLQTQPQVRATFIAQCRANPVLRQQALVLCDAYRIKFPVFAQIKQEIEPCPSEKT